ncbi:MAG: HD domain-containing protein [Egibacteraceae bacterium]
MKVALKLEEHVPNAPVELVAAALLHDSHEFAPPTENLDATLTARLGAGVTRVIRALEREHRALAERLEPQAPTDDPWTLWASAADKIVSLTSILGRAAATDDPDAFWNARRPFIERISYLRRFHTSTAPHLPATMGAELGRLVDMAELTTAPYQ